MAIPRITRQTWSDTHGPGTPESVEMASTSSWLPPYTERDAKSENDLDNSATIPMSPTTTATSSASPSSSVTSLPNYGDAVGSDVFTPTSAFHIRAFGRPVLGFPFPSAPDPISIFNVDLDSSASANSLNFSQVPAYVSMRRARSSNSCWLVRGDDSAQTPLCSTLYRMGPGRPPHIRILGDAAKDHPYSSSSIDALDWDTPYQHDMEVRNVGLMTRAQVIRSPYGLFRWRYASSRERAAHSSDCTPRSLLVLEKLTVIANSMTPSSQSSSSSPFGKMKGRAKSEILATRVGELIRSEETRTPGTKRCTAGNGGLLRMDLREWINVDLENDEKRQDIGRMCAEEEVRVFVIAGAMTMLKKEMDRRRAQQASMMAGMAGGGP